MDSQSSTPFSKSSIAVLPFDNLSNDPDQQYFSDGIQEDILNHLAKIADLNVKSRSSTLRYRSNRPSITQIGADLGVGTILEGSVRKAGNQVRITAQLIDVASDNHIWSETYDRELTEIFTIQSEVAIEIAKVLEIRLTGQQENLIVNIETENINAYDYLLRAREIRARATEEADYDNALTLLQQAIAVDDQYAEAYAEMGGILYFDKAGNIATSGTTQEIWLDSALSLANKAILLNPNLSYAYLLRSTIYRRPLFQFDKAKQDLQKAYEIDPNDPVILRELSEVLRNEGEYERSAELRIKSIELGPGIKDDEYYVRWGQVYASIGETEHAKELFIQGLKLSPSNPLLLWEMGWANHTLGDMKESINYFEKAWSVTKGPVFLLFMGEINLWIGDFDSSQELLEGVQEAEKALMDSTALLPYRPKLAAVYLQTGRESEAAELLDEALLSRKRNIQESRYDSWTRSNASTLIEMGEVLAMQGKADEAMDYLENPINWEWWDPAGALRFLENSPQFDNLRDNARFQALTRKVEEADELSSAALRKVVNEREASEQMKLGLDK
jgi:TolB-like protein/Tfp pilus assembly protein PilF